MRNNPNTPFIVILLALMFSMFYMLAVTQKKMQTIQHQILSDEAIDLGEFYISQ